MYGTHIRPRAEDVFRGDGGWSGVIVVVVVLDGHEGFPPRRVSPIKKVTAIKGNESLQLSSYLLYNSYFYGRSFISAHRIFRPYAVHLD